MITATLSLTLSNSETNETASTQISLSAGNLALLKPMVLRTSFLAFADSVQAEMEDPQWKKTVTAKPAPKRNSKKK